MMGSAAQPSQSRPAPRRPDLVPAPALGGLEVAHAVSAVEAALDGLVEDFLCRPFTHRVEHSLHVQLSQYLADRVLPGGPHPIGDTGYTTQLIRKEWPETRPPPGKKGRGSLDIAVLMPSQLAAIQSIDQFVNGRVEASIVIELGLGYQARHLLDDEQKLIDSEVQHGYLAQG